ncbi:polyketide synthase PksN [Paenibacillus shirakamiensis]|uniref:Polyketide synthase PksN n=1 Tax=Paenibacillus shirakamiensis TaxID=1265935 RepID=A0ABS4JGE8_9BACL|nr:beta-ketoacyl synthase N-terminal-like domain-containing protein [Paenibacillus shirakamiensis]MBP2000176.1 polyketide synthase PksN [Paenibacillus shirakamiensis]
MLTILNDYCNGYVAIPVILACKKQGLFNRLSPTTPTSFKDLAEQLHGNTGHLRVALRMLESLQWITQVERDSYVLTKKSDIHALLPEDLVHLVSFPIQSYFRKNQKKFRLSFWIEQSEQGWGVGDPLIARYLDGLLAIPLLLRMKEKGYLASTSVGKQLHLEGLSPIIREEIVRFFLHQGWLEAQEEEYTLTDSGRFMQERIFITATIASYAPMLEQISEVLFGDCTTIFSRDIHGHERHVDRQLNVLGSGFQHEKYFLDLEEIILAIFSQEPLAEQPKYIADMGCGDGSLLKKIYEMIRDTTPRGRVLDQFPIQLIGIDFNEKALEETTRTLKDIHHIVLQGNIGNPAQVLKDLEMFGIHDPDQILHVRSFLDHDRPYLAPMDIQKVHARKNIMQDHAYADEQGQEICGADVMQSLVEHLERWSEIIGRHGLLILEVHSLEADTVGAYLSKCESLHFDAYHGFSQQLLVSAEKFIMAAAEVGLFPNSSFFKKYPKTLPFTRITLNQFEKKDYIIRYAREDDLSELIELEKACWESSLQASESMVLQRIISDPENQLVILLHQRIVGVVYAQRIQSSEHLQAISYAEIEKFAQKDGTILQLLGLNILPEMQHRNLGDDLLEFMLIRSSLISGIQQVEGITRCKDYYKHQSIPIQDYIQLRNAYGSPVDMNLRFHEWHGAEIKGIVPNYRPLDFKNNGCGVWITYDLNNRRHKKLTGGADRSPRITRDSSMPATKKYKAIEPFITQSIVLILGKEEPIALDHPLMEMGLDSADLLELNERISHEYNVLLEPAFFFRYNTAQRIIQFLEKHLQAPEAVEETKKEQEKDATQSIVAESLASQSHQDIAIVSASCRLPGDVHQLEQLWDILLGERSTVTTLPKDRWEWPAHIDVEGTHQGIDKGSFLRDIASFDPQFFRISPKEAELMDPQQRILLELVWECIERAGYSAKDLRGSRTGVYIGASGSDYQKVLEKHQAFYGAGGSMAAIPNRISYFFDFRGPSLQIDTACSSSLVAIHQAVHALKNNECDQALVGGIHLMCDPYNSIAYYQAGMLSEEGTCRTFDSGASGYVRGEGAGVILLKPLTQAMLDQDEILAVIKGTAVNHGGQAGGLTVPNPQMQAELIMDAFRRANFAPETVGYMEAHGTGTKLGDPIEISGLKEAFSNLKSEKSEAWSEPSCGIGSIKTNVGHLEAAAGMAGLFKVILCLRYRILPKTLHFKQLNPHCSLDQSPFYITSESIPWQTSHAQGMRRAGISSFGSGGTNAHLAIEEAPSYHRNFASEQTYYLMCMSAKTTSALINKQQDMLSWLANDGGSHSLADIAATLLVGRDHWDIRVSYVVQSVAQFQEMLTLDIENKPVYEHQGSSVIAKLRLEPLFAEMGQNIIEELRQPNYAGSKHQYTALAELYLQGYDLDVKGLYTGYSFARVPLPTYPFEKSKYWLATTQSSFSSLQSSASRMPQLEKCRDKGLREATTSSQDLYSTPPPSDAVLEDLTVNHESLLIPKINAPFVTLKPLNSQPIDKLWVDKDTVHESELVHDDLRNSVDSNDLDSGHRNLISELIQSLSEALYLSEKEVDVDEKFINLGLDSIIGVEWIRTLNARYGTHIPATKVYDYPTLRQFSTYLEQEMNGFKSGNGRAELPILPVFVPDKYEIQEIAPSNVVSTEVILEYLTNSLADALYLSVPDINPHLKFIDMGLDSILGVEWIQAINRKFSLSLPATQIYAYPTLQDFTGYIEELLDSQTKKVQADCEPTSQLSMDELFEQVYSGNLARDKAEQHLESLRSSGTLK